MLADTGPLKGWKAIASSPRMVIFMKGGKGNHWVERLTIPGQVKSNIVGSNHGISPELVPIAERYPAL
jgi:hypothetical protein